ncbi:hypothetical protein GCM10009779_03390 [Polymorphospora rubra]
MTGMPQRPRSHELETESRRAFEALLPSSWVVRRVEDDYGIDLEVEIFEEGSATGGGLSSTAQGYRQTTKEGTNLSWEYQYRHPELLARARPSRFSCPIRCTPGQILWKMGT